MGIAKPKRTDGTVQLVTTPTGSALAVTQRTYCRAQWGHPLCSRWSEPSQSLLIEPGRLPSTRQESLKASF